jgi:hypothetical protein
MSGLSGVGGRFRRGSLWPLSLGAIGHSKIKVNFTASARSATDRSSYVLAFLVVIGVFLEDGDCHQPSIFASLKGLSRKRIRSVVIGRADAVQAGVPTQRRVLLHYRFRDDRGW